MPVPAPATLELLAGFRLRPDDRNKELITPTGAAVLAEWAERLPNGDIAPTPPMILRKIGYGAGKRDTWIPNLLRLMVGETYEEPIKTPAGTKRPEEVDPLSSAMGPVTDIPASEIKDIKPLPPRKMTDEGE